MMTDELPHISVNEQRLEEVERQAPAEGITEAELEAFDQGTRKHFEEALAAMRYREIQPGSPEAQEAIRDAIKQGK